MRLAVIAFWLFLAGSAAAQESACVAIENDAARLACYDAAHGRAPRAAAEQPEQAPTEAQAGPAASAREHRLPAFSDMFGRRENAVARPELNFVVARVARRLGGQYSLVMEGDEVWAPDHSGSAAPEAGEHVLIRRVAVGAYVLYRPNGESFGVHKQ
jgi:hypothetical protein